MIEKDIIKDQKETIHRLQKECTEKTEIIEELDKVIQDCNIQRIRLYKTLKEIREIAGDAIDTMIKNNYAGRIYSKINEVLNRGAEE